MDRICDRRVAVVTGGGRGLGRGHALELARHGATVVVDDVAGELTEVLPDLVARAAPNVDLRAG